MTDLAQGFHLKQHSAVATDLPNRSVVQGAGSSVLRGPCYRPFTAWAPRQGPTIFLRWPSGPELAAPQARPPSGLVEPALWAQGQGPGPRNLGSEPFGPKVVRCWAFGILRGLGSGRVVRRMWSFRPGRERWPTTRATVVESHKRNANLMLGGGRRPCSSPVWA